MRLAQFPDMRPAMTRLPGTNTCQMASPSWSQTSFEKLVKSPHSGGSPPPPTKPRLTPPRRGVHHHPPTKAHSSTPGGSPPPPAPGLSRRLAGPYASHGFR